MSRARPGSAAASNVASTRGGRPGGGSYAGASRATNANAAEFTPGAGTGASAARPITGALKPQTAGPTSPNPYAPSFNGSASSPWTSTPADKRYGKRPSASGPAGSSPGTARALFGNNGDEKYYGTKNAATWEEHANGDAAEDAALLRAASNNHPESWESYDAGGQSSSQSLTAPAAATNADGTTPLNHTPFDSPSLGPYRTDRTGSIDDASEKLELDERGTDISLSLMKKQGADGQPNELSIHMLSLLYDPPVQGCELKPYVSVVDSFGRVTAVTTDEAALNLDFRWFRGNKRLCSNTPHNCTKAAMIQCVACAKLGAAIPQHLTYFCSDKCLKESWPHHKQLHMQQKRAGGGNEVREWSCDEMDAHHERPESPSHLHCKYPSLLQNTWQETSSERAYVPQAEDVGRAIRLECSPILKQAKKENTMGPEPLVRSSSHLTADLNLGQVVRIDTGAVIPTPAAPPSRTYLYTDPSAPVNAANTFRTVCYNVLAQIYATRGVYPYTPMWALAWEYRKHLLLRDILSHQADVVCLQEVQANHFEAWFQPQLSKHGFDGIFKKKTRDAGSDATGAQVIDGCATFYKRDRFALMEQYGIEFNEAARQHTANRTQLKRLIRGNIALVLVLEELTPPPPGAGGATQARRNRKRRLCITNTHMFWDPEYPDVKLWQTWVLCQELEKLVLPRNLPLVLCGDFNSLVDSSVYELLSTERVEAGEDVFGPTGDPSGLLPAPHQVSHRLPLLSAYATIGEPKYTNYTGAFVGVLDYIFFTRTHLRCVACLDVDEESLLRQHTALPSPHYPSDHLPLVTTLEFIE